MLMAVGLAQGIGYIAHSRATKRTNAQLQAAYEGAAMEAAPEEAPTPSAPAISATPAFSGTPAICATAAATPTPRPGLLLQYQTIGASLLLEMGELYAKNDDLVGWLRIPDVVNLPVVYRNNRYYLTHDFYGEESAAGALFLDAHHPFKARTQHLVIHGHNMHDGSMFGRLAHYQTTRYVRAHGLVTFSTLYRVEKYAVFAVAIVPEEVSAAGYIPYTGTPVFQTEAQFADFIEKLKANSLYSIPIDVAASDALLTLSTCLDDDRLIVACRRLREGETEAEMQKALMQSMRR